MKDQDSRQDYEVARDELNALFAAQGFANPKIATLGLRTDESGWKHNAFTITIEGEAISWKSGTGIKGQPNPAEVLANLCREGLDANEAFGDWCATFGYEEDSRKALATYLECQAAGHRARKILKSGKLVQQFADLSSRL